jgi:hypothetical protein
MFIYHSNLPRMVVYDFDFFLNVGEHLPHSSVQEGILLQAIEMCCYAWV